MRLSNDALIATIQGAVAEQRAATLALDPSRLAVANSRLNEALGTAQESIAKRSGEPADSAPESRALTREVQQAFKINAELIHQASAANGRALISLPVENGGANVYGADGVTSRGQRTRPLGEA